MELVQTTTIKLSQLEINKGQIEGLPTNPRLIIEDKFERLKLSIQNQPDMLKLRELLVYPHGSKYVIIGGNMRFRALRELGYKEAQCKVIPKDTPVETLRAYTIKDNATLGEWDFEQLTVWDQEELEAWDLDIPDREIDFDELTDEFELDNEKQDDAFNMSFFLTNEQASYITDLLDRQFCADHSQAVIKIMKEWNEAQ